MGLNIGDNCICRDFCESFSRTIMLYTIFLIRSCAPGVDFFVYAVQDIELVRTKYIAKIKNRGAVSFSL